MSSVEEHDREQAALAYLCETGRCDHPDCHRNDALLERYRRKAHELHHDEGVLEVDDAAIVNLSEDGGAYVQTWIWVDESELEGSDEA